MCRTKPSVFLGIVSIHSINIVLVVGLTVTDVVRRAWKGARGQYFQGHSDLYRSPRFLPAY